jgi:hypothetical protein
MRNKHEGPNVPPPGWPYQELFDEGSGPTHNVGGGDTYDITKGPDDLRDGGKRIVQEDDMEAGLTRIDPPKNGSEDALGSMPEEEDEAARFIRTMEEEQDEEKVA